jgi:nicotinamidase-related amidase
MLMKADQCCLLIVDVQQRLVPAVADPQRVVDRCAILMRAAARLAIPVIVSEQYPRGIGPTVADLRALAPADAVLEKLHFSCMADAGLRRRIGEVGRRQIVVAGIEAHVCVLQTVLDLRAAGQEVFVATDACSSRDSANAAAAFARMARNGAEAVTTEMVLFEWLHVAGTAEFKDTMALIK